MGLVSSAAEPLKRAQESGGRLTRPVLTPTRLWAGAGSALVRRPPLLFPTASSRGRFHHPTKIDLRPFSPTPISSQLNRRFVLFSSACPLSCTRFTCDTSASSTQLFST